MIVIKARNIDTASNKIQHGFFGRDGGVSEGIYKSLNCGIGSDDKADNVQQNRQIVAKYFDQPTENLCSVHQVHSAKCILIKQPFGKKSERPEVDAMVTDQPNLILGILTADCGPVLFTGEKHDGSSVIGAAHSGWRGAIGGVLEDTVQKMVDCGAVKQTIKAAIGPCIGPRSYEVNIEFAAPFLAQDEANEHFFREAQKEGHLMFDLPGYIASRLAHCGVGGVTITGHDTYAEYDKFFSYRQKTHRGEPDYGRQISAIMIKE